MEGNDESSVERIVGNSINALSNQETPAFPHSNIAEVNSKKIVKKRRKDNDQVAVEHSKSNREYLRKAQESLRQQPQDDTSESNPYGYEDPDSASGGPSNPYGYEDPDSGPTLRRVGPARRRGSVTKFSIDAAAAAKEATERILKMRLMQQKRFSSSNNSTASHDVHFSSVNTMRQQSLRRSNGLLSSRRGDFNRMALQQQQHHKQQSDDAIINSKREESVFGSDLQPTTPIRQPSSRDFRLPPGIQLPSPSDPMESDVSDHSVELNDVSDHSAELNDVCPPVVKNGGIEGMITCRTPSNLLLSPRGSGGSLHSLSRAAAKDSLQSLHDSIGSMETLSIVADTTTMSQRPPSRNASWKKVSRSDSAKSFGSDADSLASDMKSLCSISKLEERSTPRTPSFQKTIVNMTPNINHPRQA